MGKIIFFGTPLLLVFVLVILLSRPGPPAVTDSFLLPASTPYNFPLKADEQASFNKNVTELKGFCDVFVSGYKKYHGDTNLGEAATPLRFTVLLPENPEKSPYYYENSQTGTIYVPAYPVLPLSKKGMLNAQAGLQADATNLPPCGGESAGTGGLIMLAFAKTRLPLNTDRLLTVDALAYWTSLGINPGQQESPDAKDTASAPVYLVENFDTIAPSQAIYQASRLKYLHTNVRSTKGLININKIEWSNAQTRIWVTITNTTAQTVFWDADVPQLIPQQGPQAGRPLAAVVPQENDDSIDMTLTGEDPILQGSLEIPPGQTVPGFISFAPVDASLPLEFTFPDVFLAASNKDARLLRIGIASTQSPSTKESDRRLLRRGQG